MELIKPKGNFEKCIKQSILIHDPDTLPTFTVKKDFSTFEYGTAMDIIVTPEVTRTDKNLKKLNPIERGCYFDGEKSLYYFKKYSQKSCEVECLTNATLDACGCVDIEQPFKNKAEICLNISRHRSSCANDLQSNIYVSSDLSMEFGCLCLPLCNSITYNIKYFTIHEKITR